MVASYFNKSIGNSSSVWLYDITDIYIGTVQPLVGSEQNARGIPPIPTNCPSAAITDVTENMRAKIYALCCKMGTIASFYNRCI